MRDISDREKVKKYHKDAERSKRERQSNKACKLNTANRDRRQCPEGQILDSVEGGQDKNTKNPVCISDDEKKCPPGKFPETRRKSAQIEKESDYIPTCDTSEPDDRGFMCPDPNTYHHK
ncbi:hypothetical protein GQ43DRAFT_429476 [Delitschia confertaspora ATCC 74209]|uniref:Uncharacterized protein n=1 Tax=Delitschia confertaspora ATCC 74209 TaxID=1513339 RepID=A0A9P4JT00_9PLEO|nr:hypothetical protein GQ43DRAFT_429476 [Delitschia confertaspora ATCC 74209]